MLAMLSLVVIESEPWCQNYLEYGMAEDEMPLPCKIPTLVSTVVPREFVR